MLLSLLLHLTLIFTEPPRVDNLRNLRAIEADGRPLADNLWRSPFIVPSEHDLETQMQLNRQRLDRLERESKRHKRISEQIREVLDDLRKAPRPLPTGDLQMSDVGIDCLMPETQTIATFYRLQNAPA